MHNVKWIRENPDIFNESMRKRSAEFTAEKVISLDEARRSKITQVQELQNSRNSLAKEIANLKKNKLECLEKIKDSIVINNNLKFIEEDLSKDQELENLLATIPNILDKEVPEGKGEEDNVEIEKWGELPEFNFKPKEHFEVGEDLGLLDFEQSVKISGSRFSTLFGDLAKLERVLSNFMIETAEEFGYSEVSPPNLVKNNAMFGSGQLPKFAKEAFRTDGGFWLIPTSEVSLVNLVREKTLKDEDLPIRYVAYTPCFRSEAGAAGKDNRGIIRQHQFKKVELVAITSQEESQKEHEKITNIACEVLKRLELPYRKMLLCSKDVGFGASRTYDLEVWLPGQNKYREISSCSNCRDFQSRRISAKYKSKESKKPLYVHTLNGSSLAVGRTIVAILENYQNQDGSVTIPKILQKYFNKKLIKKA